MLLSLISKITLSTPEPFARAIQADCVCQEPFTGDINVTFPQSYEGVRQTQLRCLTSAMCLCNTLCTWRESNIINNHKQVWWSINSWLSLSNYINWKAMSPSGRLGIITPSLDRSKRVYIEDGLNVTLKQVIFSYYESS